MFKRSETEIIEIVGRAFEKGMNNLGSNWHFYPTWGNMIYWRKTRKSLVDKKIDALYEYLGLEYKDTITLHGKAVKKERSVDRPKRRG